MIKPPKIDYLERILTARVYDVAVETPLEHAPDSPVHMVDLLREIGLKYE